MNRFRTPPAGDYVVLGDSGRWVSYGPRAADRAAELVVIVAESAAEFWGVYVFDDDPLGGQWNWVGDARDKDSAAHFASLV